MHTRTHICGYFHAIHSNCKLVEIFKKIAYLHFSDCATAVRFQTTAINIFNSRNVTEGNHHWTNSALHAHSFCGRADTRKDSKRLRLRSDSCCGMVYSHVVLEHRSGNGIGGGKSLLPTLNECCLRSFERVCEER